MSRLEEEGIKTGSHPPYQWLTSTDHYMDTLVRLCPEVVLGRHLAVTSIDSGTPWLTDKQRAADWRCHSGIVYSPRLSSTDELSYQSDGLETPGYDEWYVFDTGGAVLGEVIGGTENPFEQAHAPRPGRLMVFVNQMAFVIHDRDPSVQFLVDMFWRQLEWIMPESYIEGTGVTA